MLTIFLRSVILYAASLLAMRAMGKRQVGQLQPFELVVVIMIAELAATPMGGVGIPILYGLLPMAALVVCHGLLTALCMKSERVRVWLCGQPTVLVRNGVICEKQLRACAVDLNDLMEAIRAGGILDPLEVGTAVLEPGGNISVFPKADSRPLMPRDLGKMPPGPQAPVRHLQRSEGGASAAADFGRRSADGKLAARAVEPQLADGADSRAGV